MRSAAPTKSLVRSHPADICFGVILLLALAIRIGHVDFFVADQDTSRNHLMANHLVKYGEIPLVGLGNNFFPDSPLYYFLLAPFLWLRGNICSFPLPCF